MAPLIHVTGIFSIGADRATPRTRDGPPTSSASSPRMVPWWVDAITPLNSAERAADVIAEALADLVGSEARVTRCASTTPNGAETREPPSWLKWSTDFPIVATLCSRGDVCRGSGWPGWSPVGTQSCLGNPISASTGKIWRNLADLTWLAHSVTIELASWPALASLMLQGHNELIVDYIRATVLPEIDPLVVKVWLRLWPLGVYPTVSSNLCCSPFSAFRGTPRIPLRRGSRRDLDCGGRLSSSRGDRRRVLAPPDLESGQQSSELSAAQRDAAILAKVHGLISSPIDSRRRSTGHRHQTPAGLVAVVRAALSTQPPRASVADLRSWLASEVLPVGGIERRWLETVVDLQSGNRRWVCDRAARGGWPGFEAVGDAEGEVDVLLHLGVFARANSDNATL